MLFFQKRLLPAVLALLFSCNSNTNIPGVFKTQDCIPKFKEIELKDLIESIGTYDGDSVEISGYYHLGIEESVFSIHPGGYRNNPENTIWVDFASHMKKDNGDGAVYLNESLKELQKIDGKKVRIRGIIVGHQYAGHLARIKDVCYLEVL